MIGGVELNLTQVLVYGVPAWIGAVFAGVAMLRAGANARQLRTSNGSTLAQTVEHTHELVVEQAPASPEPPAPTPGARQS